jgi:hypothetical protein
MWMSSQQHGLNLVGACIALSRCRAAHDTYSTWGRIGSPLRASQIYRRGIGRRQLVLEGFIGEAARKSTRTVQSRIVRRRSGSALSLAGCSIESVCQEVRPVCLPSRPTTTIFHSLLLFLHIHIAFSLSPPLFPPSPTIAHTNCKSQPSSCIRCSPPRACPSPARISGGQTESFSGAPMPAVNTFTNPRSHHFC